ncbi:hypothetical protein [uncultured Gimesia sp.]|uniref:hypothetical protein n=1 Tax=uncultured Gimesia sp. TaxID=1678688 RepID=UPI002634457E|nr:hypothetical protein [uncultured Gimesia sp.]
MNNKKRAAKQARKIRNEKKKVSAELKSKETIDQIKKNMLKTGVVGMLHSLVPKAIMFGCPNF